MTRRNLARRSDIPADVLRQRRDLYALAIGLELFNLAGGTLVPNTTIGTLLPVSLVRPEMLLYAAWVGFFYFWFRFWLISEAHPVGDYLEDVKWQAGNLRAVRRIAARYVEPSRTLTRESLEASLYNPQGVVPMLNLRGRSIELNLSSLLTRANRNLRSPPAPAKMGPRAVVVTPEESRTLAWSWLAGFPLAVQRERAFTDYTLPHLFATVTLCHGIARLLYAM